MKEKVRITLKVEGTKELKVSMDIEENKALEIFNYLYNYQEEKCKELTMASIEKTDADLKKDSEEVKKDEDNKNVSKSEYQKLLDFILEKKNFSKTELKNLNIKPSTISTYLHTLKSKGIITGTEGKRGQYHVVENKKEQEKQKKQLGTPEKQVNDETEKNIGIFETFLKNEIYSEILDCLLSNESFKVDSIRNKLYKSKDFIPDVIKALDENNLISFDEKAEEYTVPKTTKIWYFTLVEAKPVRDLFIACKLKIRLDKKFIELLRKAVKLQLIEEHTKDNKGIFYIAKLK